MENQSEKSGFGGVLALLAVVICLFQIALFFPSLKLFFQTGFLTKNTQALPWTIVPPIMMTTIIQVSLWFMLTGAIWVLARLSLSPLKVPADKHLTFAVGLWLVAALAVFCANQLFFPRSLFSDFTRTLLPNGLAYFLLIVCCLILCVCLVIAGITVLYRHLYASLAVVVCLLSVGLIALIWQKPVVVKAHTKPNIIVIGLDSLRPDHVGYYDSQYALTPALDGFLQNAAHFTNAMTPLARTYPAWVSILTGRFPKEDGARYDLIERSKVNLQGNLTKTLQAAGYTTVYANDERRFSNIDHDYGFDHVIAPKLGFNDFLLGTFNDFPLGNLIINTRLGAYLFPYNHMNRGANLSYYPGTFNLALERQLDRIDDRPLFLAVHFCLTHFPYVWASSKPVPARDFADLRNLYQKSILAMDTQFAHLMSYLKTRGFLNNALVVVISDHGEALLFDGDRPLSAKTYQGDLNDSAFMKWISKSPDKVLNQTKGHGTDVLSRSQWHIVFAMKRFGDNPFSKARFDFPTSLIDIKPTILDLLDLDDDTSTGQSLLPYLDNQQTTAPKNRFLFYETGFSPDIMLSKKMTMKNLLDLGIRYYRVDPNTGRVLFRENMTPLIIANKQRAVSYGPWLLAAYPSNDKPVWVLLNQDTGHWTDNLSSSFAQRSPVSMMQKALFQFYGDELQ